MKLGRIQMTTTKRNPFIVIIGEKKLKHGSKSVKKVLWGKNGCYSFAYNAN